MLKIDDGMLRALFAQSRLELKDDQCQMWLDELNHWVDFFSMNHFPWNESAHGISGRTVQLRPDSVEKGLESSQIKAMCQRFADGFIALPKGSQKEGAQSGH